MHSFMCYFVFLLLMINNYYILVCYIYIVKTIIMIISYECVCVRSEGLNICYVPILIFIYNMTAHLLNTIQL